MTYSFLQSLIFTHVFVGYIFSWKLLSFLEFFGVQKSRSMMASSSKESYLKADPIMPKFGSGILLKAIFDLCY